jgi:hypothetical protein
MVKRGAGEEERRFVDKGWTGVILGWGHPEIAGSTEVISCGAWIAFGRGLLPRSSARSSTIEAA